jgi:hypothetical protein
MLAKAGYAPGGTWSFILDPIDKHSTRLIMRSRSSEQLSFLEKLFDHFVFDPAHFIMERKMMLGIKERAEAHAGQRGK